MTGVIGAVGTGAQTARRRGIESGCVVWITLEICPDQNICLLISGDFAMIRVASSRSAGRG